MASAHAFEYLGAQYDGGGVGGFVEGGDEPGGDITARDFARDLEAFLARGAVPVVGGDWTEEGDAPEPDVRGGTLEGLLVAIGGEAETEPAAAETVGGTAAAFVTGGADAPGDDPGADGTAAAFVTGGADTPEPAASGTVAELIA